MSKRKLLFITSELNPFLSISDIAEKISELPNQFAAKDMDVRILMPRFGNINERRHRLHEVVRLSGINVMFNDEDYALTVKVASLPESKQRLQVYFLHNDEFFDRKADIKDENGSFYEDNDERLVFFNRGIMETVKKFGWAPDFIICNGWMTCLVPLYARTAYKNDPIFSESKLFYNLFDQAFDNKLAEKFVEKARLDDAIEENQTEEFVDRDYNALSIGAISHSDGILMSTKSVESKLNDYIINSKKPTFNFEKEEEGNLDLLHNFIINFKPLTESE